MKAIIRKDEQAVSPVIATILMVAITVVLAAVLYVMVSGLIGGQNPVSKPVITLQLNTKSTLSADILVTGAQPASLPTNFKVNLQVGTAFGGAAALTTANANTTVTVGSDTYHVMWQNPGGSGNVVGGDHFTIWYPSGTAPAAGTSITLLLIWTDGSTDAQVTYQR